MKLTLVNFETMVYYLPDAETKVIVDASSIGLGATLSQKQKSGWIHTSSICIENIKSNRTEIFKNWKRELSSIMGVKEIPLLYLW